jgi:hypothetical protein
LGRVLYLNVLSQKSKNAWKIHNTLKKNAMTTVSVRTCGSDLQTINPVYNQRFRRAYEAWLDQKSGSQAEIGWGGCTLPCAGYVQLATQQSFDPSVWVKNCGSCLREMPNSIPSVERPEDVRWGGGCSLCVTVLAPWAFHHPNEIHLPTPDQIQTFVQSGNYVSAYEGFQALTPCQQSEWLQKVCGQGGEQGESYELPLDSEPIPEASSSTGLNQGLLIALCIVAVLLVGIGIRYGRQRWYNSSTYVLAQAAGRTFQIARSTFSKLREDCMSKTLGGLETYKQGLEKDGGKINKKITRGLVDQGVLCLKDVDNAYRDSVTGANGIYTPGTVPELIRTALEEDINSTREYETQLEDIVAE